MEQTPNRSPFDLTSLIPLGVGFLSLFGICLILLVGRLFSPRSTVLAPDTATPYKYLFIATEPGISSAMPTDATVTPDGTTEPLSTDDFDSTPSAPNAEITSTRQTGFSITAISGASTASSNETSSAPTDSDSPIIIFPGTKKATSTPFPLLTSKPPTFTFTPRPTSTAIILTPRTKPPLVIITNTVTGSDATATATRTATSTPSSSSAPLNPGTYDDNDPHLVYSGDWTNQTGVPDAYKETLHVSSTLDNSITFRFIGQELRLFFQSGRTLGKLRVSIDGQEFEVDQYGDSTYVSEWVSAPLKAATHTVIIRHASGGSVNLDQIIVPDIIPTATP